jgi:hypothetical protein
MIRFGMIQVNQEVDDMQKVSKTIVDEIQLKLKNIDDLVEYETDSDKFGYYSYVVSCFDNWLSRNEIDIIKTVPKTDVNSNRAKFINLLSKNLFLYKDYDNIYSFDSLKEQNIFIQNVLKLESNEIIISTEKQLIVDFGGDSFSDIIFFKNFSDLNIIKKVASECNLKIFKY